jgi:glycosyltransferase involved in cell wall biosynthesis
MANMANYWAQQGWQVSLITIYRLDHNLPSYAIDKRVNLITLNLDKTANHLFAKVFNNLKRIFKLRKQLIASQAEAVIAFMGPNVVLTWLASLGLKLSVIGSERTNPLLHTHGRFWDKLIHFTYRRIPTLAVQTAAIAQYFAQYRIYPKAIIPNPIHPQFAAQENRAQAAIIAIGRLSKEKGFDLLLEAFAKTQPTATSMATVYLWQRA